MAVAFHLLAGILAMKNSLAEFNGEQLIMKSPQTLIREVDHQKTRILVSIDCMRALQHEIDRAISMIFTILLRPLGAMMAVIATSLPSAHTLMAENSILMLLQTRVSITKNRKSSI